MTDKTEAAPAVKMQYPRIIPTMMYKYNYKRAMVDKASRRAITNTPDDAWITLQDARVLMYNPMYAIAKFRDGRGKEHVVDGGFMYTPIYDFCGGLMVTSAFAHAYPTESSDTWGPRYWRTLLVGSADEKFNQQQVANALTDKWAKQAHLIPDLHAYCGPEPLSPTAAIEIMQQSLAAALVSLSWNQSRRGIFAADRVSVSPRTRQILQRAGEVTHAYYPLPGVAWWASAARGKDHVPRNWHPECSGPYKANVAFHPGNTYVNPNSGHQVAMCSITVAAQSGYLSPIMRQQGDLAPWSISKEETDKFLSPDLFDMLPQSIFHNG